MNTVCVGPGLFAGIDIGPACPEDEGGMNAKAIFPGALVCALICGVINTAQAQQRLPGSPMPIVPPEGAAPAAPTPAADSPIADVLTPRGWDPKPYDDAGCCGPFGANGLIQTESFLRAGISRPVSGGLLNDTLETGWMVSGGLRSLFYNPLADAAWTIEFGVSYNFNNANDPTVQTIILETPFTLRMYHRAAGFVAFGRQWFIHEQAHQAGRNWRLGVDNGFRYGYARLELDNTTITDPTESFSKIGDVYGAYFIALHNDFEFPLGGCYTFVAGSRFEWCYTWSDIFLDANSSDLYDVNFMLNFGLRY